MAFIPHIVCMLGSGAPARARSVCVWCKIFFDVKKFHLSDAVNNERILNIKRKIACGERKRNCIVAGTKVR